MPPSPAYPDAVRTTLIHTLPNTDVMENVLHWSVGALATVDEAFATSLSDQIIAAWSNIQAVMNNGVKLAKVMVQDLRSTPYPTFEFNFTVLSGSLATVALPWQDAVVASLRTVHPGRRGRGRIFWGGLTKDAVGAGAVVTGATIEAVNNTSEALDAIETADSQDVLWGVLSRADAQVYAVQSWSCDNRFDVQRRRANRRLP